MNQPLISILLNYGRVILTMQFRHKHLKNICNCNSPNVLVFAISFIVVSLMNLSYLNMPPVWDAAPGVFAPAIYLFENGFNLYSLLHSPGYLDAGPNVHSLSIITFMTYCVIKLAGGQTSVYLPTLHLVQFTFAAIVLTLTFNIAQRSFGKIYAAFVTLTLFLLPVFLVQTSYLYTEVVGSALFLLGINAWAYRRFRQMFAFALIACMVKSFGLVLVFTLVVLLLVDDSLRIHQRIGWVTLIVGVAMAIEVSKWSLEAASPPANECLFGIRSVLENLIQVPDLFILVLLSTAFPLFYVILHRAFKPRLIVTEVVRLSGEIPEKRIWLAIAGLPTMFVLFLVAVPLTGRLFFPLPRYYVWILPFMVLVLAKSLLVLLSRIPTFSLKSQINPYKFGILLFTTIIIFSVLNRNGKFYQSNWALSSFSIAERSFEYIDFYKIQRDGVQAIAEKGEGRLLVVTRGEYYFLSSPLMGYIDQHAENIQFVLAPPYNSGQLADFPLDFLILDSNSNSFHGKHLIDSIKMKALNNPNYIVQELVHYQRGPYRSQVLRISAKPKESPL